MKRLLALLQSFRSPDVFNPWRDRDTMDILPKPAEARLERLRAHFTCEPKLLLLGEAPGYQGCHFSGIPFTNEKLIGERMIPRVAPVRITSRTLPWCEPSATIVWSALRGLGLADRTILWNAFAWHPHQPGNLLSNRAPTRAEVDAGIDALKAVLAHFDGVTVVPVGQVAAATLARLGLETAAPVRHPAFGGATKFRAGMAQLFGSPSA